MPRRGPRRPRITVRVAESGRTLLRNRAAAETDGNVSELARRVLKYGAMHMPKGWNQ